MTIAFLTISFAGEVAWSVAGAVTCSAVACNPRTAATKVATRGKVCRKFTDMRTILRRGPNHNIPPGSGGGPQARGRPFGPDDKVAKDKRNEPPAVGVSELRVPRKRRWAAAPDYFGVSRAAPP